MKPLLILVTALALFSGEAVAATRLADNINSGKKPSASAGKPAPAPIALTPEKQQTLARIEQYLNSITTIVSDFMQVAPDGSVVSGKFYLSRPAKMRWQYDPPTPILMVTSGRNLVYYDYELEQVSDIPLESTLAGFLARDKIKFDNTVRITSLENQQGVVRVSILQSKRPKDGKLTLEFSNNPMVLRNMVVTDSGGQVTTVSLNNARYGVPVDSSLFTFSDPRYRKKKRI